MVVRKELENMISKRKSIMSFEEETICPICKHAISPVYITSTLTSEESASILNYCCACQNAFLTNYQLKLSDETNMHYDYYAAEIISSIPELFAEEVFDDKIVSLSPQFVKIYNQALAAETYRLNEIAGIGYRKALEFLVKDFAIHENPDKSEEIKNLLLSKCINDYIENKQIATLAVKSAWIGNDETHYVRKQGDRDVSDMKAFIKAMVYFISMVLITEDASTIEAK